MKPINEADVHVVSVVRLCEPRVQAPNVVRPSIAPVWCSMCFVLRIVCVHDESKSLCAECFSHVCAYAMRMPQ